jgi:chemotaxis protein MotB
MPKETWIIAGVLTVLLLVGLLGYASWGKKHEVEQVRTELAAARAAAARLEDQLGEAQEKLKQNQSHIEELEKEKEAVLQAHKSLEDEMRSTLESKDVTISKLQGKLTVNIVDRIMFDSGEAELKPGGAAVLRKVAGILAQHTNLQIHVVGHTDNVPIRPTARSRFPSNWELSTTRATAAVRYLTESAGVDPRRLGAVGYGEFRPIADNATAEGRARNRRIAITILSEEMAGADTVASDKLKSAASPSASGTKTNAVAEPPPRPSEPDQPTPEAK